MNNEECSKGQICSSGHFCKDIEGSFSLTLHVLDVPVIHLGRKYETIVLK